MHILINYSSKNNYLLYLQYYIYLHFITILV